MFLHLCGVCEKTFCCNVNLGEGGGGGRVFVVFGLQTQVETNTQSPLIFGIGIMSVEKSDADLFLRPK